MMRKLVIWALLATIGVAVANAADSDTGEFIVARDLYGSADYTGALTIFNRIKTAGVTSGDVVSVEQYRALCYLALGDAAEAQHAVETIVAAVPFYRPTGSDISPRLESAFTEVRRRVLPDIVRQKYASAKAAYVRKDYGQATVEFGDVLRLLDDPDLADAAHGSLSDLRVLADGFVNLSVRTTEASSAASHPATLPLATGSGGGRTLVEIYTADSAEVVPPVTISQVLPPYKGSLTEPLRGALEVTIDQHGKVIGAKIRIPTHTVYDAIAVVGARQWQYKPASIDGAPVKYLKVVYINISPPQQPNAKKTRTGSLDAGRR
jgi:hypothetical protein